MSDIANVLSDISNVISDIAIVLSDIGNVMSDIANVLSDIGIVMRDIANVLSDIGNVTKKSASDSTQREGFCPSLRLQIQINLKRNQIFIMKANISLLEPNSFYHVYNRGINGENIFKENRNYPYFFKKYRYYVPNVARTYAYCLLKNHFHFLIKTKTEDELFTFYKKKKKLQDNDKLLKAPYIIGQEFANMFNGYAQAINSGYKRRGGLFEEPFRRIKVEEEDYFTQLVYYIHRNPQNHKFVKDFKDYPHSSYHSHLSSKPTLLERNEIIEWFGSVEKYVKFHEDEQHLSGEGYFGIEYD
jgi:putative transposase